MLTLGAGEVAAQPAPQAPTTAPAVLTPEEQLDEAVLRYQTNQHPTAIIRFYDLSIDASVPLTVRLEAKVYLAEIYLLDGEQPNAEQQLREVIELDNFYQVDPFRHPPQVGALFVEVRARLLPTLQPPDPPPLVWVPGWYYARNDALRRDIPLSTVEGLFAAGATGLNIYLLINRDNFQDNPADRQLSERLRAAQLSCFGGYVTTHVVRSLRARSHFREAWRAELMLSQATPEQPPLWVAQVHGRF